MQLLIWQHNAGEVFAGKVRLLVARGQRWAGGGARAPELTDAGRAALERELELEAMAAERRRENIERRRQAWDRSDPSSPHFFQRVTRSPDYIRLANGQLAYLPARVTR